MSKSVAPASPTTTTQETIQESSSTAPSTETNYRIGGYGIAILMFVYILNFLDRQIVNILAEPIKRDLQLSDKQLGLLTGLSFAVLYTTMGIPLARLAERVNRVKLIGASLFIWSGFTTLCGLAQSFGQIFLARIGVGMGEAGCVPPAHSMISAYTPKERLARSISMFMLGSPLGIMMGMAVGGVVNDAWGWRTSFILVGIPGILLTLVVLTTLKDPQRERRGAVRPVPPPPLLATLRFLADKHSFWLLTLGASLASVVNYAQWAFIASFYLRLYPSDLVQLGSAHGGTGAIGIILGLVLGIGGGTGVMIGGLLGDRLGKNETRGVVYSYSTVAILSCLVVAPLFCSAVLANSFWLSIALLVPASIINSLWSGPLFASIQSLVPQHSRATAAAISLMVISLISLSLGPLLLGATSDWLGASMGNAEGLRWALALSTTISLAAAFMFWLARRSYIKEIGA